MRLTIPPIGLSIPIEEGKIITLSVEHPQLFREILSDIRRQNEGQAGEIIISEEEKEIKLSEKVLCIFDPFGLDPNNKKILIRLYKDIQEDALDRFVLETSELRSHIVSYLDDLISVVPYDMTYDYDMEISTLLKCFSVRINPLKEDFLSELMDYVRVHSRILNLRVCVAANLKYYLSKEEWEAFVEFVTYEKIHLIIIENRRTEKLDVEKNLIVDLDKCIIEVD